jgi:hypothetical protein
VVGIISMFTWLLPLVGIPVSILGLALGIRSRNRGGGRLALWGLILSAISGVLVAINFAVGLYMGYTKAVGH